MDLSRRNPLSAFLRQGFAKDHLTLLDLDHITPVCKGAKSLCLLVLFRAWAQKNEERRAAIWLDSLIIESTAPL